MNSFRPPLRFLVLLTLVACSSGGESPNEPGPGGIKVNTITTGVNIDPDGYTLLLDNQVSIGLPVNGSGTVSGIEPGSATVDLANVMGNCSVAQPRLRTLAVEADAITETSYTISCVATTGTLNVYIGLSGANVDQSISYSLDGGAPAAAVTNFDMAFTLGVGQHTFVLSGIAANCVDSGGLGRTFTIAPDATTYVEFDLVCVPTVGTINIVTQTTGALPDPDGYFLSLDGAPAFQVHLDPTGSLFLADHTPGAHTAEISDLAANCSLAGPALRQVTVAAGDTTIETFSIDCPPSYSLDIAALTTGLTLDPNGYQVSVDGGPVQDVVGTGITSLGYFPPGTYTVSVSGVSANCSLAEANPRTVTILSSSPVVPVTVTCSYQAGPRANEIAFTRFVDDGSGTHTNEFDIYGVAADGTGLTPLVVGPGYQAGGSWSPDGARLVYEFRPTSTGQNSSVRVRNADGSNDIQLAVGGTPSWSPDGSMIAYVNNGVWIMQADGSNPRRLYHVDPGAANNAIYPTWSPDGSRIAYMINGQVVVHQVNRPVGVAINPFGVIGDRPSWSPDGSKLTFGVVGGFQGTTDIAIINADGSGYSILLGDVGDENYPTWSGDGTEIMFAWAQGPILLWKMNSNGTNVVPVTTGLGGDGWPAWGR